MQVSNNFVIKSADDHYCNIVGYASIFNIADQHNDIIQKGAFHSLNKQEIKFLWQHDQLKPLGIINEIYEDNYGLKINATINSEVATGKEAIALLKQKAIDGLSIGINIIDSTISKNYQRIITKAELVEVSIVTFPANRSAKIYHINNSEKIMKESNFAREAIEKINKLESNLSNLFNKPLPINNYEDNLYLRDYLCKGITHNLTTKALSGQDNEGGVLLSPTLYEKILHEITVSSPIRQLASIQTISTNALDLVVDKGNFNCEWVAEQAPREETDNATLEKKRILVHELYAQPKATQKLIDDSAINVEEWLVSSLKESFTNAENEAFINGDGNNKPYGILSYEPSKEAQVIIKRQNIVEGLLQMINTLKEEYVANATFLMNRQTLSEIQKLKDNYGRFIWQANLNDNLVQTIFGIPVKCSNHIPNYTMQDKPSIILGDIKVAYQIVDRQDIDILRDPYTSKPFIKFYAVKRVGGDVVNHNALVFGIFKE